MKQKRLLGRVGLALALGMLSLVSVLSLRAQNDSPEKKEKKDEAVAHAKKITADLETKIKELEAQAAKQTGEIKARSQAEIKDLKAKRTKASQKVTELSRATKASWEKAKEGFADAYRDLASAYDKAAAEFKK